MVDTTQRSLLRTATPPLLTSNSGDVFASLSRLLHLYVLYHSIGGGTAPTKVVASGYQLYQPNSFGGPIGKVTKNYNVVTRRWNFLRILMHLDITETSTTIAFVRELS